jgi:hypothetical protein
MTATPWNRRRGLASRLAAMAAAAAVLAFGGLDASAHNVSNWKSGTRGGNMNEFATWRGTLLGVAVGWAPWNSWSSMLSYFSGTNPKSLKAKHPNVSIAVGLFPTGGSLSACAAGQYDANFRTIGSRLASSGVGDAEIRLGWEPGSTDRPWHAVNRPADQWRSCFVRLAKALKGASSSLRIAWHMNKKGSKATVSNLWDSNVSSVVTNIGVSHYDDAYARFGTETSDGQPWGLRAWLSFAQARGKKLEMAEWGVGRLGDRPSYIQQMHDFFHHAGAGLAHEGYFNSGNKQLYPSTNLPRSAALYRELF